jgi:hypothetical protein
MLLADIALTNNEFTLSWGLFVFEFGATDKLFEDTFKTVTSIACSNWFVTTASYLAVKFCVTNDNNELISFVFREATRYVLLQSFLIHYIWKETK